MLLSDLSDNLEITTILRRLKIRQYSAFLGFVVFVENNNFAFGMTTDVFSVQIFLQWVRYHYAENRSYHRHVECLRGRHAGT